VSAEQYADKIYRLQTRLESFSKGTGQVLASILVRRFKALSAQIATGSTSTLRDVRKLEREFAEILELSNAQQEDKITAAMTTGVTAGYGAEIAGQKLLGGVAKIKRIETQRILNKAWAHILQEQGISVEDFWGKYIGTSSTRVKTIPRLAYQNGWSITKTVNKLRDVTQIDKRTAVTLARTSVLAASNEARHDVMRQAGIDVEIYKATLDSRTSAVCRGLDGKVFDFGVGPQPPIHPNCRSVRLAVPDDMTAAEMKRELEVSTRGPSGKTEIKKYQTYGTWLQTQPKEFIESVIGQKRTKMLLDGRITFDKMYTQNGKYLTVEQLETKYS
jgi:SPP1 gp7 family putative phage head morphogenesis protein